METSKACGIHAVCQTCRYINQDYKQSLKEKYDFGINLLREGGLLGNAQVIAPEPSPRPLGYRTHAKLAVRPMSQCANPSETGRFAFGLFQPESHQVVDLSHCPLHKETINRLVRSLKPALEATPLMPYDDHTHEGDLRYIAIRASHLTDELMVTFVMTNDHHKLLLRNLVNELRKQGHLINSAHLNINAEVTNVIFGPESQRLAGADRLRERLCDLDFEIGPTSFFQVNPWQAEIIYRRIEQLAGTYAKGDVAWDLYCGTGQISMLLAKNGYRALGIEANPQATRDAQANSVRNRIAQPPHYLAGKVEDFHAQLPTWATPPRLIVVNPARKGLAEPVRVFLRDILVAHPETRLMYLSCEIETLTRDLSVILGGTARLRQLEAFDMFPFTEKMEWLAIVDSPQN